MNVGNYGDDLVAAGEQIETIEPFEKVEMEPVREKRLPKLTPKSLLEKLETLQKTRKSKLNKVKNLMAIIKYLMSNREYEKEVQCSFEKFIKLRDEAREMHNSVMVLLPSEEKEKQQPWFSGKMLICNGFINYVEKWLSAESQVSCSGVDKNVNQNDVNPEDRISNISRESSKPSSKKSSSRVRSGRSSASSAQIMAEADKAALIARASALKEKHALELQQEKLRHRQEQLDIDAQIAAATAKIAVLNNSNHQSLKTCTDDMQTSNVMQNSGGTSTPNICRIMQKQNEITALLVQQQQQQSSTLPQIDIPVFEEQSSAI